MAQVADPALVARIDHYLEYLLQQWNSISALAAEWPTWDADSQLVFMLNWDVAEDRLGQLAEWSAGDLLTPRQQERFQRLQEVIAEQRPTLQQMFAG